MVRARRKHLCVAAFLVSAGALNPQIHCQESLDILERVRKMSTRLVLNQHLNTRNIKDL